MLYDGLPPTGTAAGSIRSLYARRRQPVGVWVVKSVEAKEGCETNQGAIGMSDEGILRDVTDVRFGVSGTVIVEGTNLQGDFTRISLPILSLNSLIPKLVNAITMDFLSGAAECPTSESPIPDCLVTVLDGHAFATTDTKEPGLTLHTCAGTLQFHFAPETAAKIAKDLSRIATEALPPVSSMMN